MDTRITSAEIANGYLLAETHTSLNTFVDALRLQLSILVYGVLR